MVLLAQSISLQEDCRSGHFHRAIHLYCSPWLCFFATILPSLESKFITFTLQLKDDTALCERFTHTHTHLQATKWKSAGKATFGSNNYTPDGQGTIRLDWRSSVKMRLSLTATCQCEMRSNRSHFDIAQYQCENQK